MPHRSAHAVLRGIVLAATAILSACTWGIAKGKVYDITREAAKAPVTIVPDTSVGPVRLDMTKEDVVRALGMPDSIFYGDARFTLQDSPTAAYYVFGKAGLSVFFQRGKLHSISVLSELYEYPGGIRVGMNVSRVEAVAGKMLDEGYIQATRVLADSSWARVYRVVYSGTAEYRLVEFGSAVLKVDEASGMITELRILSTQPSPDFGRLPDQEEPFEEKEAKARRAIHTRMLRDSGIPLDRCALVPVRYTSRAAEPNEKYHEYPMVEYWYIDKYLASYEEAGRVADSFIAAIDSMGITGPSVSDLVERYGPPSAFLVVPVAGDNDKVLFFCYGGLLLQIDLHYQTLSSVMFMGFGPDYRYQGKIGVGSTQEAVYAELGKPLRTAPEGLAGTEQDRTLFISRIPEWRSSFISYEDKGLQFDFKEGKVDSITRSWHPAGR